MVKPTRPCNPGCPGWRVARVLAVHVVRPCPHCWQHEILRPNHRYYERQPECRLALTKESTHAHETTTSRRA